MRADLLRSPTPSPIRAESTPRARPHPIARGFALSLPLTSVSPGTYILSAEVKYGKQPVQKLSRAFTIEAVAQLAQPEAAPISQASTCFWDPLLAFFPDFLNYCWLPPWIIVVIIALVAFALYRRTRRRNDQGY